MSLAWQRRAACAVHDPELWFPVSETSYAGAWQVDDAKTICRSCPVQQECLDYAIRERIDDGIYGATTPAQRVAARRRAGRTSTRRPSAFVQTGGAVR